VNENKLIIKMITDNILKRYILYILKRDKTLSFILDLWLVS